MLQKEHLVAHMKSHRVSVDDPKRAMIVLHRFEAAPPPSRALSQADTRSTENEAEQSKEVSEFVTHIRNLLIIIVRL
ncbi:unnamed protein product [Gongylonema pulchrum]|uniref:C2H2-type domain-containing protein n=1 Tax=Gongylonema pulchrum TaxID=637853 RepID=A0A183EHS1_9BILA|nr:unnamed protein product [Gongylonema pulchrum]